MKKIGIITSPLTSGHSVRGVGFYTKRLLPQLEIQSSNFGIEIIRLNKPEDVYNKSLDLVHYPFFDLFRPSLPVFKSLPTIVTIHDVIPLEFPQQYPPGILGTLNLLHQRLALKSAQRIITDSYASVNSIHQLLKEPHEKIKLVYLAADPVYTPLKDKSVLSKFAVKYHIPDQYVLYVGDVNWNKNLFTLCSACENLKIDLVIIGKQARQIATMNSDHPELHHLKDLKISFNNPQVHLLGYVPDTDLAGIYNLATVYCQPSYAEGFGLPILESLACGTPVIASKTHSLPEVGGDAALYFDPYSSKQLEGLIRSVISDNSLRNSLIKSSLEQSAKFSWKKTALNTLSVYRELL